MCDITPSAEVALPADLSAARRARSFVRDHLCPSHHAGVVEPALLLVTELAVNAVEHGAPPVRAALDCRDGTLRLLVSDGSRTRPVHVRATLESESGRGVALVDTLSTAWGVRPDGSGKTVWCDLAL